MKAVSILCEVTLLVRLQGKFELDHFESESDTLVQALRKWKETTELWSERLGSPAQSSRRSLTGTAWELETRHRVIGKKKNREQPLV